MQRFRIMVPKRLGTIKHIINQSKGFCSAARPSDNDRTTHFGFETVPESEKVEKGMNSSNCKPSKENSKQILFRLISVRKVFEDVAASYDLMNDAMSMGTHRIWKDIFMERLAPTHGTKLLDMAGGTGDIAFRYLKYLNSLHIDDTAPKSHVTVSDINQSMLDVGKVRAESLRFTNEHLKHCAIDWVCANAESLPFENNSFSAYTIAFGIRNCTHVDKVILLANNHYMLYTACVFYILGY